MINERYNMYLCALYLPHQRHVITAFSFLPDWSFVFLFLPLAVLVYVPSRCVHRCAYLFTGVSFHVRVYLQSEDSPFPPQ